MRIRNNSKKEWIGYCCGDIIIDILPESEFTIEDKAGRVLLRNLGAAAWLVEVEDIKEVIKQIKVETLVETEKVIKKSPFCVFCDTKGYTHKKNCTRPATK